MSHSFSRSATLVMALSIAFGSQAVAQAETPTSIHIAAQPLGQALNELARQTGLELIVDPTLVAGREAPALSARLTPQQALERLLSGSGLTASRNAGGALVIRRAPPPGGEAQHQLPLLTARAGSAAADPDARAARRSSSGTKTDTPLLETPQAISVLTRQQLEDQKPRSIPEALNYSPGTFTGLVGSSNRYDYVALRGFKDSSVDSVLLDGMRMLSDQGSYTSMQVDPYVLERIDVVRGPASVLYGRASPGGLVVLSSQRPQFQPERELQLTLGNRQRVEGALNLAGPIDGQGVAAYRLVAMARKLDSQFQGVREERVALAPSVGLNLSSNTYLLLQAYLQRDPQGSYHSGVPADASLTSTRNGATISRHFFDGDPSVEQYRRTQRFVGYQLEHSFNNQWSFRQHLRVVAADARLRQVYGYGWASPTTLTRYFSGANESTRGHALDNQLEGRFASGALQHHLLIGLDYQKRKVDGDWSWGGAKPIDVYQPVYGDAGLNNLGGAPIDRRFEQTGLYLQDQLAWERWRLTLGGRQDWARAANRMGDAGTAAATWSGSRFTKRLGLVHLFDNGFAPYVGYADGFNPSLRNDKEGRNLQPAETRQTELGLRYQPKGSQTLLSAALYELTQDQVASRPVGAAYHVAAGKVRSRGLELEARGELSRGLNVLASYTFNDMKYLESPEGFVGKTPYQAPRQQASAWLDWSVAPGYTLGAGLRHIGSSWVDNTNQLKVPAYTLADLMLRIELDRISPALKGAQLRLSATNVADKTYIASCMSMEYCYWGDARNLSATLSYRW
ncbi:TonB-dependent siderophore receptor [Roseateles sp. DAIF2]|uniref:TonB-dependent siderophore receptor n=1 Tax=Roseateles sp. DAIF2 TaxID=2714952 RepID=UPI0018A31A77|nr:TonB-dependent siderophore receptor [Roseateles sp. DAIF2]QPF72396.1 TonB-dependent siderophore receptor [Roseateles sp. DAIF2]